MKQNHQRKLFISRDNWALKTVAICTVVIPLLAVNLLPTISAGQQAEHTIITVAGNGVGGFSGDRGPATAASLNAPTDVAIDAGGNLIIADQGNSRIRAVITSQGVIDTIVDSLNGPRGVAAPTEVPISIFDFFIADEGDNAVLGVQVLGLDQVNPATFIPIVGVGNLNSPADVAVDNMGNLFIVDRGNHRILRQSVVGDDTVVVAGNGIPGFGGDNGPATEASLNAPTGVAIDLMGNLFIADSLNHRIRRVDATTGIITTVAGNGLGRFNGDGGPATEASFNVPEGVTVDPAGNLVIADTLNHRVRQVDAITGIITTVAGNGISGFNGDNQPATQASLNMPTSVVIDLSGNLYISDRSNHRIRKVVRVAPSKQQYSSLLRSEKIPH